MTTVKPTAKKKIAKKAAKAATKIAATKTDLVAGRFRPDSFKAKLYDALKDGKPHTMAELTKAIPGCANPRTRLKVIEQNGVKLKKVGDDQVQFIGLGPDPRKAV